LGLRQNLASEEWKILIDKMTHIKTSVLDFKSKLKWQGLWSFNIRSGIPKDILLFLVKTKTVLMHTQFTLQVCFFILQ